MNTSATTNSATPGAGLRRGLGAGDPASIADAWQVGRYLWPVLRALGYQDGFVGGRGANSDALAGQPPHLRRAGMPLGYLSFVAAIPDASVHHDIQLQHLNTDLPRLPEYRAQLDVVLQDVPFKQWPSAPGQAQALADYGSRYLAEGITLSARGGISVSLIHPQVLDSPDPSRRKDLARQADLVGALRLPPRTSSDGFGSAVDVVMLRHRPHGTRNAGPAYTNVSPVRVGDRIAMVNEYFATHPGNVLGQVLVGPGDTLRLVPVADRAGLGQELHDAFKEIGGAATQLGLTGPGFLHTPTPQDPRHDPAGSRSRERGAPQDPQRGPGL
jgi:hypothetical protein